MFKVLAMTLASIFATSQVCGDQTLHVAAEAKAGGNGSPDAPFRTLGEARDAIRAAKKASPEAGGEKYIVQIAPGIYPLESTFTLSAEDSGTAGAPVVYRAGTRGESKFQGGLRLEASDFKKITDPKILSRLSEDVREKVLVADLSTAFPGEFPAFKPAYKGAPVAPWLYLDGSPMTLARWPNLEAKPDGWARFIKAIDSGNADPKSADPKRQKRRPGSFEFNDPRPERWNLKEGVWLFGYWTHDWSNEVIQIANYDQNKKIISLAAPHSYGISSGTWGGKERRFFALNTLDELDAPEEWYLDRAKKLLYFHPTADWEKSEIVLGTLNAPLIKISGAQHIKFEGLRFEYGHEKGIALEKTSDIEIVGCTIANLANSGVAISNGSKNTIRSCDLYHLGTAGITVSGGDRKTLTPAENLVINNHIHHYGLFQRTYAPGIGVSGVGQIVRNNSIHDAPHNAILYSGNDHLFEQNEIFRVVMETGDSGAFYTGRDWTSQGNQLRQNYIHHLGSGDEKHVNTMGVYLDDCDSGDTIEQNIFYKAGRAIMIGGGRDNAVINNLVIDCPIGLHIDSRGMTWKQWNNPEYAGWNLKEKAEKLNYTSPPWSTRYPSLAKIMNDSPREPLHNRVVRNVFIDSKKQVLSFNDNVKKLVGKLDIADNIAVNSSGAEPKSTAGDTKGFSNLAGTGEEPIDLGFIDAEKLNFQLKPDARLLKEIPGFEPVPFDKIGLFVDEYRTALPK
ncbi:right-handed parallel beta-helix repeat-containing protein [Verrucomicrobiales bacterium BCK34]|nr:right-handed parallel beta-helix repeat-containing protein [Verrucomicrobiales bacterium BCK34]